MYVGNTAGEKKQLYSNKYYYIHYSIQSWMINSLPTFSLISNANIWNRAGGNDEHLKGCGHKPSIPWKNKKIFMLSPVFKCSWRLWWPWDPTRGPEVRGPLSHWREGELLVSGWSGSAWVGWKGLPGGQEVERFNATVPRYRVTVSYIHSR